jgi:glycosyltransferase involved in cell wall biosynthesis
VFVAQSAMSVDALSPFGRGANAPLNGRTILQIVPPLAAGGDERATLAVIAALAETGARALVATDSRGLAGELQAIGGVFVHFPAATKNPLAMALNMRRLQRIIASERVDLVHVRSRWAAWTAVKACRKARCPLVTSLPGDGVRTRPRSSFETAAAEGDTVIAPSEFVAGRAQTLFPAPPKRLRIVRAGMDLSKLQPERVSGRRVSDVRSSWGVAVHERVVLMPARLARGRGQQTLIEAAALIKGQGLDDVRFVLAGEAAKPMFARELDALAIKRGVQSMLIRVGAAADAPAAFIGAAVVVFPATEVDGVTRTSIEAAAIGALTIISDVGSAREIVAAPPHVDAEARTGWLVPPREPAALAEAIHSALSLGASAREAVRRRSRAKIAEVYSLERMTRDTLSVYAEALAR